MPFQLYFFSIEFGLSSIDIETGKQQNGGRKPRYKVYGAGLLSSAGELQVRSSFSFFWIPNTL